MRYDIRGLFPEEINADYAQKIGANFVKYIEAKSIAIGYDNRFSSPGLAEALINSIPCQVVCIGLCSSPMLYFAIEYLQLDGGIMVTASHNPIHYNGFKLIKANLPLTNDEISVMLQIEYVQQKNHKQIIHYDISKYYLKSILNHHSSRRPLRIAWDLGHCTVSKIIGSLIKKLPMHQHFLLNDTILEYATVDPMVERNLSDITTLVRSKRCTIGFAFDSDGDRLRVIDHKGYALSSSEALLILVRYIFTGSTKHETMIVDVKVSDQIVKLVEDLGGSCVRCRTGHSFIKHALKEHSAIMGGDGSGHIFFAYDDALYAALLFIEVLSHKSWKEISAHMPAIYMMPERRVEVENKNKIVLDIKNYLHSMGINFDDTDGIRVDLQDGWWLIRASNTEEVITICCEGDTENDLQATYNNALDIFNETLLLDEKEQVAYPI